MRELVRTDGTGDRPPDAEPEESSARRAHWRRLPVHALVVALACLGLVRLPLGDAAFVAVTDSVASQASTLTIDPPTNVTARMDLGSLILPTCRATVRWSESPTEDITGYQIQRIRVSTGEVMRDNVVNETTFQDVELGVGVILLSSGDWDWRVRARYGKFASEWVPATESYGLFCNRLL